MTKPKKMKRLILILLPVILISANVIGYVLWKESSVVKIDIEAKKWEFIPNIITVEKDTVVRLSIKSSDINHGFSLPEFKVNGFLKPGETIVVQFKADVVGEHLFLCNVFCGLGHPGMKGTLFVR